MRIIVTGAIGFIGFHLCKKLIQKDCEVLELIILILIMIPN